MRDKPVIYHIPVCPFSQRVEILLELKGLSDAVQFSVVDITRPRDPALLAKTRGTISGSFSVYYNRFSSFIAQQANGFGPDLTGRATPGPNYSSGVDQLARHDFVSVPADFYGAEAKVNFQLQDEATSKHGLEFFGDSLRASNRDTSEALPRISPGRAQDLHPAHELKRPSRRWREPGCSRRAAVTACGPDQVRRRINRHGSPFSICNNLHSDASARIASTTCSPSVSGATWLR